jgi:hypothetical protein
MGIKSTAVATHADRTPQTAQIRASVIELIAVAFLLFAAIVGFQKTGGAFSTEFLDDEASHYISGLMVYTYLTTEIPRSPLTYLKNFHSYYPLVGIGHWGPFYYLIEAVWMLVVSTSRSAMLLLSATVTMATGLCCYAFVVHRLGRLAAIFVAFAVVLSPIVQRASGEVMLDMPVAFFCVAAMMAYGRFLDTGYARYSALFGLLATAALLIKGNAACLALLPPFAVLIGRRFDLLRIRSFWLPVPIVGLIAGPWYIGTYSLVSQGFRYRWGFDYIVTATLANSRFLLDAVGPLVLVCGIIGLVASVARPKACDKEDSWLVSAAALFAAVWTFQSVVPAAIQDRYLAPDLPPLLILAVWGARIAVLWGINHILRGRPLSRHSDAANGVGLFLLAVSFVPGTLNIASEPQRDFTKAAQVIWENYAASNPSVLVGTDATGEGSAIADLAMIDPHRPSLFAVRGSRLLGGGGYNNQDYMPRFQTAEQVMAAIDDYAIPFVLLSGRSGPKEWAHLRQLDEARVLYPDRWELIYHDASVSPEVLLFRIRGNPGKKADIARLLKLSAPHSLE